MEPNQNEQLLFGTVERVIFLTRELNVALAEYGRVYEKIAGRPPKGIDISELLPGSKNLYGRLTAVFGDENDISNSGTVSTSNNDSPRLGIRARTREFLRQRSPRFFTAEAIAKALGIKISSVRYELYQLRNEKVVEKVGIDQWRFADSGDSQNPATDPRRTLSTSAEPIERPKPPAPDANESAEVSSIVRPEQQSDDEWHVPRNEVLDFLSEDKGKVYTPEQITKTLGTDRDLTCEALERLKMDDLIEKVGGDLYGYKKQPGEA